jgi:hypothetical protein
VDSSKAIDTSKEENSDVPSLTVVNMRLSKLRRLIYACVYVFLCVSVFVSLSVYWRSQVHFQQIGGAKSSFSRLAEPSPLSADWRSQVLFQQLVKERAVGGIHSDGVII